MHRHPHQSHSEPVPRLAGHCGPIVPFSARRNWANTGHRTGACPHFSRLQFSPASGRAPRNPEIPPMVHQGAGEWTEGDAQPGTPP